MKGDLTQTWQRIEPDLLKILGKDGMYSGIDPAGFMNAYTAIYNYCVHKSSGGPDRIGGSNSSSVGRDIYEKLEEFIVDYVEKLQKDEKETFLAFYVRRWRRFAIGASQLNKVFGYMNRYWVAKERNDGHKSVLDIYNLCLSKWKSSLFIVNSDIIISELLDQIKLLRMEQFYEPSFIKETIESVVRLGIDEQDLKKPNNSIYNEFFEKPFLKSTEEFYRQESSEYLKTHNINDYMEKAEFRIRQEELLVEKYLEEKSRKSAMDVVHKVLITEHADKMYDEFNRLLVSKQLKDLQRMYALLSKVSSALTVLAKRFEEFVKVEGRKYIDNLLVNIENEEQNSAKASIKPPSPTLVLNDSQKKLYVKTLLSVYEKYSDLVAKAFANDADFIKSLDIATKAFVNNNSIAIPKNNPKAKSRTPEYLAKYSDMLMKRNVREADGNSDMNEDEIMTLFKFLEDKDAFEKFYTVHLSKRLIYGLSVSLEVEENIISRLQKENSVTYTSKMTNMFQDMKSSKELNVEFASYYPTLENSKEIVKDFEMFVLSETMWPFHNSKQSFILPKEMKPTIEAVSKMYLSKHSGRQLKWLWHLGKGELKANIGKPGKSPFILTVTTYQMAIILPFNDKETYTFSELLEITGLPDPVLKGNLQPLIKFKLLSPDRSKIENGTKFTLVKEYKSKKLKVNFSTNIKHEQKKEMEDINNEIKKSREMFLEACIVRIMKARKQLSHTLLVDEVINQSHTRFNAHISDIKKAIESLIDKEYIRRLDASTYEYLA